MGCFATPNSKERGWSSGLENSGVSLERNRRRGSRGRVSNETEKPGRKKTTPVYDREHTSY